MTLRGSLRTGLIAASLIVSGCGATVDQLKARAAFDLDCNSVTVVEIDDRTRGVEGCGQRATYVENCAWVDGYGGKHDCTWILNTDATRHPRDKADKQE
jgi:hypothetical protein